MVLMRTYSCVLASASSPSLLVLAGDCLPTTLAPVLEKWVQDGGVLLATFDRSDSVDISARVGDPLGEELERARAYLQILKIRMGERLSMNIDVPDALKSVPLPPMMLQTLVENAIKHGLEPVTGGGSIWILARTLGADVSVTVADDGRGFNTESSGTGIGLKNVRERLRLAYGDAGSFAIVANFPKGVAATITVPAAGPKAAAHA